MRSSTSKDDQSIRSEWAHGGCPPTVFILGLHRSGTTFLYEALSQVLPVAKLTVHDVVFYKTLIASHMRDGGDADRQRLTSYFQDQVVKTRGRDPLSLSPKTAEEYGWILKRERGSFVVNDKTTSVLKDIVLKLRFLNPDAQAVLLKNPWDTSTVSRIAREFPDAKFVFIRRDPIDILNSELGNMLYFTADRDPLIGLLTNGITGARIGLAVARTLRKLIGTNLFSRLYIRLMIKDIARNTRALDSSFRAVAGGGRTVEVTYGELVDAPVETLEKIAAFVGLPVDQAALSAISPSPRRTGVSPLIASREKALRAQVQQGDT